MMSEFLSCTEGDTNNNKQDCELKEKIATGTSV
jgi:hypothetical protein